MMDAFTKAEIIEGIRSALDIQEAADHPTMTHLVHHHIHFNNPEELLLTFDNGAVFRVNIMKIRREEV